MSVENLKEYARRCAEEPELRAKAKALGVSDVEGHMREAGSLGLHWTMDDMVALRKEVADAVDAEGELDGLSEEELEQVAGGAVTATVAAVSAAVVAAMAVGAVGAGAAAGAVAGGAVAGAAGGGW